eukprot:592437_1
MRQIRADVQYIITQPRLWHIKKANTNPTMHLRFGILRIHPNQYTLSIMPPTANKPKITPLSNVHLLYVSYTLNTDANRWYPFSFHLPFSTTTASTPSPPPLSPSFHHNINNDIVISMDEDTKLRRSISQYLIINKDKKTKRLSIHQRHQTMGPVLQRKAVNIAPNTTTFQILADYHPFTMDQAMERGRCSSDDAVYRYKSKTDIKNITASSSITSIQSQCDALNKMMFDELHSIKLNQQQFSKQ